MLIRYTPSAAVADAFDFFFYNAESSLLIGTLARADFLDAGRFTFLEEIYNLLELFGYEPGSSTHVRAMVRFFAALDEILGV